MALAAASVMLSPSRAAARWAALCPLSVAAAAGDGEGRRRQRQQLVLYSKPGCCLCDGLKEKVHAALSALDSVDLQVRDITANPEWERLYQYEIPVLAKVLPDGTEATLPRLSPRLGVELIQKKLAAAFED